MYRITLIAAAIQVQYYKPMATFLQVELSSYTEDSPKMYLCHRVPMI